MKSALLIAVLTAPALPALACSPALMEVTGQPVVGEACAMFWVVDQISGVGISPAEKVEGGFTMQDTVDGNACYSSLSFVLTDCHAGEALILGPDRFDLMAGVNGPAIEELRIRVAELAASGGLSLDAIEAEGKALGLTEVSRKATVESLVLQGRDFPLGCGCKTLFPELAGGG